MSLDIARLLTQGLLLPPSSNAVSDKKITAFLSLTLSDFPLESDFELLKLPLISLIRLLYNLIIISYLFSFCHSASATSRKQLLQASYQG
jgi:hypothetical protein